jgi:malic enzyme
MVEHRLPKPVVAGSIPVSRSIIFEVFFGIDLLEVEIDAETRNELVKLGS